MKEPERLTLQQFELFQKFIYERCGIKIDPSKITLVSNRIRRRLRTTNCADFGSYYQFVISKSAGPNSVEFTQCHHDQRNVLLPNPKQF